jgi:hypothetical protein
MLRVVSTEETAFLPKCPRHGVWLQDSPHDERHGRRKGCDEFGAASQRAAALLVSARRDAHKVLTEA